MKQLLYVYESQVVDERTLSSLQSRPRRTAASSSSRIVNDTSIVGDALDPDYLALSARQRRAIDRAFERGVRSFEARGNGRKRRRVEGNNGTKEVPELGLDDGGGEGRGSFLDDDGGEGDFMVEDEDGGGGFLIEEGGGGGGFLPDDVDEGGGGFLPDNQGDGGFLPDDHGQDGLVKSKSDNPPPSSSHDRVKRRIPLYLLPSLLASLGLPSDEDVLQVFRASASGWKDENDLEVDTDMDSRRRKRLAGGGEDEDEVGVEMKDFRAVCAALMGPDDNQDNDSSKEQEDSSDEEVGGSDAFELSGSDSDLSSLTGSEYGQASTSKRKAGPRVTATDFAQEQQRDGEGGSTPRKRTTRRSRKTRIEGKPKLSTKQKEMARDIWDMLKPKSTGKERDAGILGRDEVKHWVRTLGEMWSDEEITEMVTLFSSQHEGRGVTFDDFGGIMLRAGLV
ncbi:hypothetical protein IAR55_005383 [Kwoniella newhampshirensis]|uniref:Uncharacterized protein n=1 Tax=Kwoniella newhampshirensis TaxID=1651941 RepID=A0AAW0YW68_9TREE